MPKLELNIAHLYPELLNIYGDKGNITAFANRCIWRDIDIKISEINENDNINPNAYDFYFIGGGQDTQQVAVAKQLQQQKAAVISAAEVNAVFLAICGGYQLLGKYYQPHNADRLEGVGVLDAYTIAGNTRFIGNVTAHCSFSDFEASLVGFENHSGLTYLQGNTTSLAKIKVGNGNNGQDKTEGARYKNIFGTYLHGSLLPKNPKFTDYLISLALEKKYNDKILLKPLDDEIENIAHQKAYNKKY